MPFQALFASYKVISLSPNTTEIIYELINQRLDHNNTQLLGSIYYPGQPDFYKKFANVGGFQAINIDKLLKLKPNLVITWQGQTQPQSIALLKRFNIPVKVYCANSLKALSQTFEDIGVDIKMPLSGQYLKNKFNQQLVEIKKQHKKIAQPPSILLQIASHPIFVVGGQGILNDIIRFCGGYNVFAQTKKISFETSLPAVVQANPQIVIMLSTSQEVVRSKRNMWTKWYLMQAVKSQNIFDLPSVNISQYSPKLTKGVEQVCQILSNTKTQGS